MTTLFHSDAPVKTARPFGRGLLRSTPSYRADHTAADAAWLASEAAGRSELDRLVDEMAAEREALSRLEAGLCC